MEIDARNQSLQGSMDRHIDEAHLEENLLSTAKACGHIIEFQGKIKDLTWQLRELREEVARSSQQASTVETQQDEALA